MPDNNITPLKRQTLLKAIENSVGSKLFNSLYVRFEDSGKEADILNDGMYSCAFYVSSLLYLFEAVDKPRATVKSLRESLDSSESWERVDSKYLTGDIVFYEKTTFDDGSENEHVGFVLNENEAVSTDYQQKCVARHPLVNGRAVEAVYRYRQF